ncbi:hypothetical protein AYI68_g6296 [Smittium mucronatum]|nr:hypothetical protein AYI68_g6296 [Smittium mucronatum]
MSKIEASRKIKSLESLSVAPSLVNLTIISGYLYSSYRVLNLMDELSDSELCLDIWVWCCDTKFKMKSPNDKVYENSSYISEENKKHESNHVSKMIYEEKDTISGPDFDEEDFSDFEFIFKHINLDSKTSFRKAKLEYNLFSNYISTFEKLSSLSLDLFKFSLNKEVQRIFKNYINLFSDQESAVTLEADLHSNSTQSIESKENHNIINEEFMEETSPNLKFALKGLGAVIEYISKNLLEKHHLNQVLRFVIGELDNSLLDSIVLKQKWSVNHGICFGKDVNKICECVSDSLNKSYKEKRGFPSKHVALEKCKEASYLISLPQKLLEPNTPDDWSSIEGIHHYPDPKEIASVVKYKFFGLTGSDPSKTSLNEISVTKFLQSGMDIKSSFTRKAVNSKNDDMEAIKKLKAFNIRCLSPSKVGVILQTRVDQEYLFSND